MASKTRKPRAESGFTLVELLVSIAIFSLVAVVIMGAVISIIDANRKAQTMASVINNLNFALESMTRSIKTGTFSEGWTSPISEHSLQICDEFGHALTYYFDEPAQRIIVERWVDDDCNDGGSSTQVPLTAPEVKITGLDFYGFPANDDPEEAATQPAVLMSVRGYMELKDGIRSDFNVQTTVAMRALNISQ